MLAPSAEKAGKTQPWLLQSCKSQSPQERPASSASQPSAPSRQGQQMPTTASCYHLGGDCYRPETDPDSSWPFSHSTGRQTGKGTVCIQRTPVTPPGVHAGTWFPDLT